jgi:hypothetical protein
VVVVDPPAAVVVVEPPAEVVVVAELPPAAVVVVAVPPWASEPEDDALGGGRGWFPELAPVALGAPPVSPLIHIPKMTATRMAARSCQVFQDRRSLILSCPGWGVSSDDANGASTVTEDDVTDLTSNKAPV